MTQTYDEIRIHVTHVTEIKGGRLTTHNPYDFILSEAKDGAHKAKQGGPKLEGVSDHAAALWHAVILFAMELKSTDGVIAHYPDDPQIAERAVEAQQALSVAEQALRQLVLALRDLEAERTQK